MPNCWRCKFDEVERAAIGHSTVGTPLDLCESHFQLAMVAGWNPVLYDTSVSAEYKPQP